MPQETFQKAKPNWRGKKMGTSTSTRKKMRRGEKEGEISASSNKPLLELDPKRVYWGRKI